MPSRGKGKKKKRSGSTPVSEMDFSAAENFIPPLNIDFNVGPGTSGGGFFDQKISNLSNMGRLNKLINQRKGKSDYNNQTIIDINRRTVRAVTGKITKTGEFIYTDRKPVKPGIPYHIHYTKNLEEHYMTGVSHNHKSKLILPLKSSRFSTYNVLNKQSPISLNPVNLQLTDKDYTNGVVSRFFARKANEVMSAPFEILSSQFGKSPLYIYTSFSWVISGNRDRVRKLNTYTIYKAKQDIPNIGRLLSPLQFYRGSETLITQEEILNKLGVVKTTQQTTTESSTTANTTTTAPSTTTTTTQTQTGPPPGVMGGGAGGAGGGGGGY